MDEIKKIDDHFEDDVDLFIAVNPFKPSEEGQLEFKSGDIIRITERQDDGWWKGMIHDRIGSFPSNYVKPLNEKNSSDEMEGEKKDSSANGQEESGRKKPPSSSGTLFSYLPPGGLQTGDIPVLRSIKKSPTTTSSVESEVGECAASCSTCGCNEFKSNVFKPGSCNNCFHRHSSN